MVLLVVAGAVPLVIFNLVTVYTDYRHDRQDASRQALDIARSLARSIDVELRTRIATLEVLALSHALSVGDLVTFRRQADTVVARLSPGGNIVLLREGGQQLMNTALPPGEALPVRDRLENQRKVFATGLPSVSDVSVGKVVNRPVVAIDVPVLRPDGSVGLILALNPTFEAFAAVIQSQNPAPGWIIALLDGNGVRIARVPHDQRLIGQPPLPDFLASWSAHREAVVDAISPDGPPVLAAFSRLAEPGWGVSVAIPTADLTGQAWRSLATTATVGLVLLALGFWLAYRVSRSVTEPISALRRFAAASTDTENEPVVVSTGLAEADEVADVLRADMRQRNAARASLELALNERTGALVQRDMLLREVHHRVKNNLQMVDGLLMMQARQLSDSDAKEGLATLRGDVQALGLVHEQLLMSADLETFDVAPFLHELSANVVAGGSD
jgi:two-component sensor histidine kinase